MSTRCYLGIKVTLVSHLLTITTEDDENSISQSTDPGL